MAPPRQDDFRSRASREALHRFLASLPATGLALSVGGGPERLHPRLLNLDLRPLSGVDVVADAHRLPFPDACLAGVHMEATLEHLDRPEQALAELARTLRPGALLFSSAPFLQAFHPCPDHFANPTLPGHRARIQAAGLTLLDSGVACGPVTALSELAVLFVELCLPRGLRGLARLLVRPLARLVRPLDAWVNHAERFHPLAATTYVLAQKPGGSPSATGTRAGPGAASPPDRAAPPGPAPGAGRATSPAAPGAP